MGYHQRAPPERNGGHENHIGKEQTMKKMKRFLILLLALLAAVSCALGEDMDEDEDWEDTEEEWREYWEEEGFSDFCEIQDDTLVVFEGMTALGLAIDSYWDFELETQVDIEPKFESGPYFDRSIDDLHFRRAQLPSTLRYLGEMAFTGFDFTEFTLPAQLEVLERYTFVYCDFDVLRIECVLPFEDITYGMEDCTVKAYEVPDGHPLYKTVDGVLFTSDGKTLLAYPNGRQDTHYDVPAGVEHIARAALCNEYLQTVSLPMGLIEIEDFAFANCSRLQSIVLPLTVRELGEQVFDGCVSLELLSLPEGMTADRDTKWVEYYPDDAIYRGDNGDTLYGKSSEGDVYAPGVLRHAPGTAEKIMGWYGNRIDTYETAEAEKPRYYHQDGKVVYLGQYKNGRVCIYEPLGNGRVSRAGSYAQELGWVDMADVEYLAPEALFEYADIRPAPVMKVWWNHLPEPHRYGWDSVWVPWETVIPTEGREYEATLFGAYVRFDEKYTGAAFACAIQDAELERKPDDNDDVYGIVFNPEITQDVDLYSRPGEGIAKTVPGGTQVLILDELSGWTYVTDGQTEAWVRQSNVKIVPEAEEEAE